MRGTRQMIVAGALLLAAGTVGSMALAAGDDHSKPAPAKTTAKTPAKAPAKAAPHGEATHVTEAKPAAKKAPAAHDHAEGHAEDHAEPAGEAAESEHGASEEKAPGLVKPTKHTKSMSAETFSSPDAALEALKAGNARWVAGKTVSPNTSADRRSETATNGQKPFATIYTCADSRLPAERIFDRGVGDVFVLRIAGNVIGEHQTGTIEYGVEHLKTPLLVVMGHTKCGAVKAACAGGHVGGSIDSLLTEITPAVDRARAANPDATDAQIVEFAVNENVWQSVFELLRTSEIVRESVESGKIKIVGAVCDISTGKVNFLGEHPWQSQLMQAFNSGASNNTPKTATKKAPARKVKEAAADEDSNH
jgi:carbonic anhydrase